MVIQKQVRLFQQSLSALHSKGESYCLKMTTFIVCGYTVIYYPQHLITYFYVALLWPGGFVC